MMQNRTESKSTLQDSPLGCTFDHDFCLLALLDQIKAFFNFILEKFRALSAKSICLHCSIKQTLEIFTLKCFVLHYCLWLVHMRQQFTKCYSFVQSTKVGRSS